MRRLVIFASLYWLNVFLLMLVARAYVVAALWLVVLLVGGTYLERWLRVRCDLGWHKLEYYPTFVWCRRCETGYAPF